jgi:hypothetical protein
LKQARPSFAGKLASTFFMLSIAAETEVTDSSFTCGDMVTALLSDRNTGY